MNYAAHLLLGLVFTLALGNDSIITQAEILDLQLLQTYQGTPGVFGALNKTITATGSDFLKKRLLNPLHDEDKLKKRQEAIMLLDTKSIDNILEHNLRIFKTNEQGLYCFIREQDPIAKQSIDNLYFKNRFLKRLNDSPAGLDLGRALHAINLFAPVVEHVAIHFFINEALHEYLGMCCSHSHHHHGHEPEEHKHEHHHKHEHKVPSTAAVWAYRTYNITHTLIHMVNLKELAEHLRQQAITMRQMQEQLIQVRCCLDATKALVKATDHLSAAIFEHQELLRAVVYKDENLLSPELYELISLLEKNTFSGSASILSRQGNILRAYTLALQTMPEFLDALEGVGEIDTLRSCNQLLHGATLNTPFCFVQFTTAAKPQVKLFHFWNLLNKNPNPVQEPFALGTDEARVALITGANKAGKSTASSAICQALLCAQTLGIAPAQLCSITPFAFIRTCFNANTKVCDGQSLFSASIDFADCVLSVCKQSDGFIFVATDELFNSTEFTRGQKINDEMAATLASFPNTLALISTHFATTTQPHQAIMNLKAEAVENLQGTIYHLSSGTSDADTTLELMRDSELLKRAGLQ